MKNLKNSELEEITKKFRLNKFFLDQKYKQEISVRNTRSLSFNFFLKFFFTFIKDWFSIIIYLLIYLFHHSKNKTNISFFIGFPNEFIFRKKNSSSFENFWKKGVLSNFCKDSRFFIITDRKFLSKKKDIYYINNLNKILIYQLNFKQKIKTLFFHIFYFFIFLGLLLRNKNLAVLSKDLSCLSLCKCINLINLNINVFINANTYQHNIISYSAIEKLKTFFCYYSINNQPIKYSYNIKKNISYKNYYRYLILDYHLIWNKYHFKSLKKLGLNYGQFKITGPYVFYLENYKKMSNAEKNIIIFDVEPYKNTDVKFTYYNCDYSIKFINDIIFSLSNFSNIKIFLKHKVRSTNTIFNLDEKYSNFLKSFGSKINILSRDTDIFYLLNSASLTISYPYTSTASFGKYYKIDSIYYDPSNSIQTQDYGVPTIKGIKKLNKYLTNKFS